MKYNRARSKKKTTINKIITKDQNIQARYTHPTKCKTNKVSGGLSTDETTEKEVIKGRKLFQYVNVGCP